MVGSLHSLRNHMLQLLQWRFWLLVATGPVSRILYLLPAFTYQGLWPDTIRISHRCVLPYNTSTGSTTPLWLRMIGYRHPQPIGESAHLCHVTGLPTST